MVLFTYQCSETPINRKTIFTILSLLIALPTCAHGAAFGVGGEYNLLAVGLAEIIWSVTSPPQRASEESRTDYALSGRTYPGNVLGATCFAITNSNVYLGFSAEYRNFAGNFQTPKFSADEDLRFNESTVIFRMGYVEYFQNRKWKLLDFGDPLPANAFGNARFGVIRSEFSESDILAEFDPAISGLFGLEVGGIFLPVSHGYMYLSAFVDYTFTIIPYKLESSDTPQEIYLNVLFFGIATQFGFVSENPY